MLVHAAVFCVVLCRSWSGRERSGGGWGMEELSILSHYLCNKHASDFDWQPTIVRQMILRHKAL